MLNQVLGWRGQRDEVQGWLGGNPQFLGEGGAR